MPDMPDIAQVLWGFCGTRQSRAGDRDRFVLSNGHGSMLLYSLLYLTGYPLTIEDLQHFRQLGSKTPGHPSTTCPAASRPPPGRWARDLPTPSVWRSRNGCSVRSSTVRASTSSITTLTPSAVTAA